MKCGARRFDFERRSMMFEVEGRGERGTEAGVVRMMTVSFNVRLR